MPASLDEGQQRVIVAVVATLTLVVLGFVLYGEMFVVPALAKQSYKRDGFNQKTQKSSNRALHAGLIKTFTCMVVSTVLLTWPVVTQLQNQFAEEDRAHISSSINFCEADFLHSRFMAEPANTISSATSYIPLAIAGMLHHSNEQQHFVLSYLAIFMIGIGSTLLHTFLSATTQGGDELPMLWYTAAVSYCGFDIMFPNVWGLGSLVAISAMVCTAVYIQVRESFIYFYLMFSIYVLVLIVSLIHISLFKNWEKFPGGLYFKGNYLLPLARAAALWLVGAAWVWVSEMLGCPYTKEEQTRASGLSLFVFGQITHPVWHFSSAMVAFLVVQVFFATKGFQEGKGMPSVEWVGVPLVVFNEKREKVE